MKYDSDGFYSIRETLPDNIILRRFVIMMKGKLRYIIFVVIVFITAVLIFWVTGIKEDKMVIRVAGWDMEYTISERRLAVEDFENIELGSFLEEIENKL